MTARTQPRASAEGGRQHLAGELPDFPDALVALQLLDREGHGLYRDEGRLEQFMNAMAGISAGPPWWGDEPTDAPERGVYTFVAGGIEAALDQAKAAAGAKDVTVMGGADTSRQYLRARLVDELSIHLVPVLLGGGTRMLEHIADQRVQLERVAVTGTPAATHLRLRVLT